MEIIDPIKDPRWMEFLESREDATIFHHPAWLKVLRKQYGFEVFSVCIPENKNFSSGIMFCIVKGISGKRKCVSLPFSDHSEPLIKDYEQLQTILDYVKNQVEQKKISSVEIRSKLPEDSGFRFITNAVLHKLKLDKPQGELFASFNKSRVQRGINKAVKENLTSRISTSYEDMEKFYALHLKTRKKLGVPIQPKNFFRLFLDEIIKEQLGFICIVEKEAIPLAAGIFFGFGKTIVYKYGASEPSLLHLKPNHLMFWTALSKAYKRSFSYFDFGKTDNDGTGLRDFKAGWAAVETPLYYSYFPATPGSKVTNILLNGVLSRIIKFSPCFVCRIIGEIFYKFAP